MITFTVKIETVGGENPGTGLFVKSDAKNETNQEIALASMVAEALNHTIAFLNKQSPDDVVVFGDDVPQVIKDSIPKREIKPN